MKYLAIPALTLALMASTSMPILAQDNDRAKLTAHTETWIENWRVTPDTPTDFDTLLSLYSTQTYTSFDFGPPAEGFASFEPAWAYYQQLLGNSVVESWRLEQIGETTVELREDIAWTVSLVSLDAELKDGTEIDVPVARVTLIFEREAEGWKIVHEHGSVPMSLK